MGRVNAAPRVRNSPIPLSVVPLGQIGVMTGDPNNAKEKSGFPPALGWLVTILLELRLSNSEHSDLVTPPDWQADVQGKLLGTEF